MHAADDPLADFTPKEIDEATHALLDDWCKPSLSELDLSRNHQLTLRQILALASRPVFQSALETLRAVKALRAPAIEQAARQLILERLCNLAQHEPINGAFARELRLAIKLLNDLFPPPKSGPDNSPASVPPPRTPPTPPTPPTHPPDSPPAQRASQVAQVSDLCTTPPIQPPPHLLAYSSAQPSRPPTPEDPAPSAPLPAPGRKHARQDKENAPTGRVRHPHQEESRSEATPRSQATAEGAGQTRRRMRCVTNAPNAGRRPPMNPYLKQDRPRAAQRAPAPGGRGAAVPRRLPCPGQQPRHRNGWTPPRARAGGPSNSPITPARRGMPRSQQRPTRCRRRCADTRRAPAPSRSPAIALPGAIIALCSSACVQPEARGPLPLQSPAPFTASGDRPPPDRRWTALGDAALNNRVQAALDNNFSLAAARERLNAARALARRERSALYPTLDGRAGAEVRDGEGVEERTELSLGLQAAYEADLWGRIESAADAERLRADATEADFQTAAMSVAAEVALAWCELAEARAQLKLIASQIQTNREVLQIIEQRFAVGQSGSADVLRQRQLVEASREQAASVEGRAAALRHRLALLEGRPPQQLAPDAPDAMPAVPDLPDTGLPAELLQRRPDVRAAMLRLQASDADAAAAVKDQYPSIDLAAALTTASENPSGLFNDWIASLAAQITAPLYDGGRRRAEVRRTAAIRRELLAEYGQTVLAAFGEVEDALSREASELRRIRSIRDQLDLAETTSTQLRTQYLNGAADYIAVLTAIREQQQLERDLLDAQLARLTFRIALYRALAGAAPGLRTPANPQPPNRRIRSERPPQ